MRDLLVFCIVLGSLPLIFMRPWIGIIMWCWLGFMSPHRLTWGFAYNFQFSALVAAVTLVAVAVSSEKKRIEFAPILVIWVAWVLWMNVTTVFALTEDSFWHDYDRSMKIQLFSFLTIMLINTEKKVEALMWVTTVSLGFFGIKGGIFSILTGGNFLVWGPPGSFLEDNNALGLALVMTLPLMYYMYTHNHQRWIRMGYLGAMALTSLAILTTHSRGAFLALIAMAGFLWLKSRKKAMVGLALILAVPLLIGFMPEHWLERMHSIKNYKSDGSAMGRINAWWFAWNLALDHPITGGGFGTFTKKLFLTYAPNPEDHHDAHSIYFEVLAEHGFVGLFLFLSLGAGALLMAGRTVRMCKKVPQLLWAADLNRVVQVSLVGYAVGGAFLGLAYFDLYYHLVAIVVLTRAIVNRRLAELANAPPEAEAEAARAEPAARPAFGMARAEPDAPPPRIGDRFASSVRER